MEIINRPIGEVIGCSKVLLNSLPISSCTFTIDNNILYIEYNGCLVSHQHIENIIESKDQLNSFIVSFYNRLIEVSQAAYYIYNMNCEEFKELVIDKIDKRI